MDKPPELSMSIMDFTMTYLDPLGIWIGIFLSIPVFWTWYQIVWGQKRQQRRLLNQIKNTPGNRAAILIVDCLPELNIRAPVMNFIGQNDELKNIPDKRIFELLRNTTLSASDTPDLVNDLRIQIAAKLLDEGVDKLHYFHAGPAAIAAFVGAEFANKMPVILYQYTNGQYENFGPLKVNL